MQRPRPAEARQACTCVSLCVCRSISVYLPVPAPSPPPRHVATQIERAFGAHTAEIKANLERGTALPD